MAVDKNGFVYITGRSEDSLTKTDVKHYDYYTIKYNPSTGKVEWGARYDNNIQGADEATAIAVDSAGNVYVTGRSQGSVTGYDFATIKYDTNGVQKWVSRYFYNNGNGVDEATAIAVDSTGNIYVTGRSQGSGTDYDYATIKYDTNGVQKWDVARRYNFSNGADEATAIAVDSAGNVYVTGRSQGSGTGFDYATIKYDTNGVQQGDVCRYDYNNGADEATAIALDTAGNVYVTGRSYGGATGFDYLTVKYDIAGKLVWRARYNNKDVNGADEAAAIALDSAGNVYVTGRSYGGTTALDYATVKYKQ
jgi:predicted transcriptional regulator